LIRGPLLEGAWRGQWHVIYSTTTETGVEDEPDPSMRFGFRWTFPASRPPLS